jgi:hypothetical protein
LILVAVNKIGYHHEKTCCVSNRLDAWSMRYAERTNRCRKSSECGIE